MASAAFEQLAIAFSYLLRDILHGRPYLTYTSSNHKSIVYIGLGQSRIDAFAFSDIAVSMGNSVAQLSYPIN